MVRKWNYTDNVYYQSRSVGTVLPAPKPRTLSAETLRKMQTRRFVFLTEDEILNCLTEREQYEYMHKAYRWLIRDCHVGPFWLSDLCWAYVHFDPSELTDAALLRAYHQLDKRRLYGPGF